MRLTACLPVPTVHKALCGALFCALVGCSPAPAPEPPRAPLVGGWSELATHSAEDELLFRRATQGTSAESLVILGVAKQVVAGMNYSFRCSRAEDGRQVRVQIFAPLPCTGEAPRVTAMEVLP